MSESARKKRQHHRLSLLDAIQGLVACVPIRDLRYMIRSYLDQFDLFVLYVALCCNRTDHSWIINDATFPHHCAFKGYLSQLKWLHSNGAHLQMSVCTRAAAGGQLETLQWLKANNVPLGDAVCACAAGNGHLATLQWLRANGVPWDASACAYAANNGQLATLQWMRSNGAPWNHDGVCRVARAGGHKHVLEWTLKGQSINE